MDTLKTHEDIREEGIVNAKKYRVALDAVLQEIRDNILDSAEKDEVIVNVQQAIMWLGMELKRLGTPNPYPNSRNPENTIVDPTADNVKL
jgi:hypothetical protein